MQWKEVVVNDKKSLQIYGYSKFNCIDLIKEIENLNDNEKARIVCDEKSYIWAFDNNHKFNIRKFIKLGIHDVIVNEKTISRYRKYFNFKENEPIILICSSEFGTVGIIKT